MSMQLGDLKCTDNTPHEDVVIVEINPSVDSTAPYIEIPYKKFVATLIKKFEDPRLELCHAAMGVTGEAGELCDAIKRHAIYGKEPDIKNIVEELGDLEFYMQDVRTKYGLDREVILQHNAEKLQERYVGLVYSDEAAIARADKESKISTSEAAEGNWGLTKEQQGSN